MSCGRVGKHQHQREKRRAKARRSGDWKDGRGKLWVPPQVEDTHAERRRPGEDRPLQGVRSLEELQNRLGRK